MDGATGPKMIKRAKRDAPQTRNNQKDNHLVNKLPQQSSEH